MMFHAFCMISSSDEEDEETTCRTGTAVRMRAISDFNRSSSCDSSLREAVTVGRNKSETVGLDDELRAIEKVAGVLARDRKLRFCDHFLQRLTRKRGASRSGGFGQTGKILTR
jgi:hypothetical protein